MSPHSVIVQTPGAQRSVVVVRGLPGPAFDLEALPEAGEEVPTHTVVRQDGRWVRATWAQLAQWLGAGVVADGVLGESGEFLIAETGVPLALEMV